MPSRIMHFKNPPFAKHFDCLRDVKFVRHETLMYSRIHRKNDLLYLKIVYKKLDTDLKTLLNHTNFAQSSKIVGISMRNNAAKGFDILAISLKFI